MSKYLWINLTDLTELRTIGPFGSPLNLMIRRDMGDYLLSGAFYHHKRWDDNYVVIECTPKRCEAIKGAIEAIGKQKIGRKVRTKTTEGPPTEAWEWRG